MPELLAGLSLGLGAGLAPGPLLALVVTSTLERGFGAGVRVAIAPLLTDAPIIGLTVAVVSSVSDSWLRGLAIAGGADVISAVFRNTILQLAVPDNLRGRLSSIHVAVSSGGPRLGDFEAGAMASLVSVPFSIVSGGIACILGALFIRKRMPELDAYVDMGDDATR